MYTAPGALEGGRDTAADMACIGLIDYFLHGPKRHASHLFRLYLHGVTPIISRHERLLYVDRLDIVRTSLTMYLDRRALPLKLTGPLPSACTIRCSAG